MMAGLAREDQGIAFECHTGAQHAAPLRVPNLLLTSSGSLGIKESAAVAATRGDLGQLAPRKKLLKSW
jgi:hypothetical protein